MYNTITTTPLPSAISMSLGRTDGVLSSLTNKLDQSTEQNNQIMMDLPQSSPIGQDIHIWALPTDCTALIHALLASFSVIIVSELGDKTFIITAIMAMKNSRLPVFLASACALLLMTVLSVGMGVAVTVIPEVYTHYMSIVLFICFGFKMLKEAYDMKGDADESEFEEVKRSLEEENKDEKQDKKPLEDERDLVPDSPPDDIVIHSKPKSEVTEQRSCWIEKLFKTLHFAPLFINVFTMVFVAEWGDRSQISTVILAAREDVVGVFIGSFVGHVLCTGLAVIGGKFVAEMISVRTSKYHLNIIN